MELPHVTRQSEAKTIVEKLLNETYGEAKPPRLIKLKQIKGRMCIFLGGTDKTNYWGHTWGEAIVKISIQIELNKQRKAKNMAEQSI